MGVDQLVCDGTVMGFYQEFDEMRPNLIIYRVSDDDNGLVKIFFNKGIQGEEPSGEVVQATILMTSEGVVAAASDNGYFRRTGDLASHLKRWALRKNANIIDSDFHPKEVYELHQEAYRIGKQPVRQ